MRGSIPKQYLLLQDKRVIEHTLSALLAESQIAQIVVCIAPEDENWGQLACADDARVSSAIGGETRAHSVLNGMLSLASHANDQDWLLVHDAARPCLSQQALSQFVQQLSNDDVGGILALRSNDTVKRATQQEDKQSSVAQVETTLNRDEIWYAQTPQMFRYGLLKQALESALACNADITDEASAIELAGHHPKLIEGERRNLKITKPEDLQMANFFLESKS